METLASMHITYHKSVIFTSVQGDFLQGIPPSPCHGGAVRRRRTGGTGVNTDGYGANSPYATCGMQAVFSWEIVGDCAFSKHLITSQNLSKPLITPGSTRPVCVPHPVMLHLCSLQRFCLHEGIGNRSTVSSPHTPQPLRTHFPSGFSATVSTAVCAGGSVGRPTTASGLYRLRPAGLPGRSFHCTPGLCSVFLSRSQK